MKQAFKSLLFLPLLASLFSCSNNNNVDSKIGECKLLHKADKVLEITAMNSSEVQSVGKRGHNSTFNWAIGY